ncbi:2',3'-cyclic-nucleotide 2'-phosphodiesterase / 3'-nucleotidase [Pseudorhodobacter antarcticus]|uniref:2',3'-cyclic-nucleotide 2'-phosphodiesterase / 3'-nucleotidase n=1 Tax=Pseudorhodobacter antarcticus TaxID=1077947 RepID=A0A1H8AIE0_9RHOB|nr:2',3'-cyclic-nucleotide 2'-phosphodiesterase / 3'-nucleotidase [Pseudorhodobacter antarcticus]
MTAPHLFSAGATGTQAHLRILQTTDLHAHVYPFDYYQDHEVDTAGLARTAALIASARAEVANSILLDNGDLLHGSALGDYMAYDRGLRDGDLHPVIAAMNALRFDAANVGNHEFNFGLPFLMAALGRAAFPVISANALTQVGADARRDARLLPPYVILDRMIRDGRGVRHPIRIGVLGLLPPQIVTWDEGLLRGRIQSRCMVQTAAALIPEIREAGADIVVVLAHTGIGAVAYREGMENAAQPLARLPGVDALITGHTHMVFPSPQFSGVDTFDLQRGRISGTPAVMAGFWGSHLGLIDLVLDRDGGRWRVLDSQSMARPIAVQGRDGDAIGLVRSVPAVTRAARGGHEATLDYMRSAVGETQVPLHSYFAVIKDCPSVQIICQAQARFVAQQLAGTEHGALPLLSAAAPFKVGGWAGPQNYTHIPVGPLYQRNLADLYCFPNTISALRLTGADVVEWLERSASAFCQVTLGVQDQVLLNDGFPSYNFDVIAGLTYEIDPTKPARYSVTGQLVDARQGRIRNLCHAGQPIDVTAEFILATNNYRASTQGALNTAGTIREVFSATSTIRNILLNEVSQASPLALKPVANWRFVAMPDTSFVFETSPLAAAFLPELQGVRVDHVMNCPNGFGRYRLWG